MAQAQAHKRSGGGVRMPEDGQLRVERAEIVIDDSGRIAHAGFDDKVARLVDGLAPDAQFLDCIHPDDKDLASTLATRALGCGRSATIELRWRRSRDRWSWLTTCFERESGHNVRVTLRRDDATHLRRAEEQMRRVVEGSAQGIIVRTRDETLYMNNSFAKLLGFPSSREFIAAQSQINGVIHPDDIPLVMGHLEARIRGEEVVSHYEFRLLHRDGSPIWVEAHAANVNWDGKTSSLSWINDISKRKAMEQESLRSKDAAEFANRTKTQFLANMSHELRTPLNAILGFSEVIEREMFGPVAPKYLDYVADIGRSGRHLLELVNDVLDLSKLEAGKLDLRETDIVLPELIEECLALVRARAESGGVRLSSEAPGALPMLRADARSLKQLLLNFLSNAVKFTPEGGQVSVSAAAEPGAGFTLSVTDTGIGMTKADIDVALQPFGQIDSKLARRHDGTGLGLPICRSLMELHDGELRVASTPNVGTTLTAWFPPHRIVRPKLERASG
jgi:PAS domain S-box-containing protein